MALRVPKSSYPQLFKDGYKNIQGVDEAVLRNIQAIHELTEIVRTSFGKNKMVINHLEKLFVTNDATTIIRELEVVHPAAKLLVMASQQQEQEVGDATNFVMIMAGELLQKAEYLLRMGLHPSEIIQGYEIARDKVSEILQEFCIESVKDLKSPKELSKAVKTTISSKQYGNEDILTPLVIEAAHLVMPKNPQNFNVDNIRVVKVMGSSIHESRVVKGMVFGREPEGIVRKVNNGKIAVFTCSLDLTQTETKGTVLIHNAKEMLNFTKGEEHHMEKVFKELADADIKVVVTGSSIGELALHYLNRFNIMVVKVLSKFDLRRLCKVLDANALARLGVPTPEEMGYCDIVETVEIGGDRVTVFRQENETTKTATIIIRGATQNHLDDIERAIDGGINIVKAIGRDNRLVPGAGATEMELLKQLVTFEIFPRTIAENSGLDATKVLAKLYSIHYNADIAAGTTTTKTTKGSDTTIDDAEGCKDESQDAKNYNRLIGVDIENEEDGGGVCNVVEKGILDCYASKLWAIKFATDAALTVLRVDQIIMSKPAGGPKAPKQNPNWDED
nr:11153_t:CDS:2 [Entrophospora candida]